MSRCHLCLCPQIITSQLSSCCLSLESFFSSVTYLGYYRLSSQLDKRPSRRFISPTVIRVSSCHLCLCPQIIAFQMCSCCLNLFEISHLSYYCLSSGQEPSHQKIYFHPLSSECQGQRMEGARKLSSMELRPQSVIIRDAKTAARAKEVGRRKE